MQTLNQSLNNRSHFYTISYYYVNNLKPLNNCVKKPPSFRKTIQGNTENCRGTAPVVHPVGQSPDLTSRFRASRHGQRVPRSSSPNGL